MPMITSSRCGAAAIVAAITLAGCHAEPPPTGVAARMRAADMDLLTTAAGPDMLPISTWLQCVQAASLVDELSAPGPFTVFAPTNDAFAALPSGVLDDLLKPEHKAKLRAVLLHQVHAGGAILAGDARSMDLPTVEGHPLAISVRSDGVRVDDARVVRADVVCTNGVIHWIDKVLMP
jgi:uncharacterized surface protein with fasciclin (FAS1) repeats